MTRYLQHSVLQFGTDETLSPVLVSSYWCQKVPNRKIGIHKKEKDMKEESNTYVMCTHIGLLGNWPHSVLGTLVGKALALHAEWRELSAEYAKGGKASRRASLKSISIKARISELEALLPRDVPGFSDVELEKFWASHGR